MGLMDYLSSAVDAVKDGDITDLMNGGLIGNKIMRDQKLAVKQAESRKKPGKLCDSQCPVNDMRCEACLKQQQEIIEGLEGLNALEITINSLKEQNVEIPGGCSLCGAPIEKGVKECPYCGTAYQIEALITNLPKTDLERDQMLLDGSTKVFALYTELYKMQMEYKKENVKLPGIVKGFTNIIAANLEKGMTMNAAMIRQGANDNGVSYPTYIAGVMTGQYQSVAMINLQNQLQQQHEIMEESRRRQEEIDARNREIRMNQLQQQREARLESTKSMMKMISSSPAPQYNGGGGGGGGSSSLCCGNCAYYIMGDNKCAKDPAGILRINASYFCWSHKSK